MAAPLSVIIPTLNSAQNLPGCLACLMEGLEAGLVRELVISDGGSQDATVLIGDDVGAVVVVGDKGRGGQLDRGKAVTSAPWLLFLHSDTELSSGWSDVVFDHIRTSQKAAFFRLAFKTSAWQGRLFSGGANLRARRGLPYGDQGMLISAEMFDAFGGYGDLPLMEDVALVRRLRGQLTMLAATANTNADRYEQGGWFRRGARNIWTMFRFWRGADPTELAREYYR